MKRGRKKLYDKKYKRKLQKTMGRRKSKKNRNYVLLHCKKCGEKRYIKVNDKSIYTEEIMNNWICLLCRPIRRKR